MRIAVVACLCFGTVSAQEQLRVRPAEVQQEDVVAALGALGVDVLRFDFSDFTRENYDVAVYLDEADSTGTERLYTVRAGGTRQQLTRMPEEVRRGFRKELHLPETTTEYVRGRSLTLIFFAEERFDEAADGAYPRNDAVQSAARITRQRGGRRTSLFLQLASVQALGGRSRKRRDSVGVLQFGLVRSEGGRRAQLRRFRNRSRVDGRTGRIVAALLRRRRHIREEGIAFRPQAGTIL